MVSFFWNHVMKCLLVTLWNISLFCYKSWENSLLKIFAKKCFVVMFERNALKVLVLFGMKFENIVYFCLEGNTLTISVVVNVYRSHIKCLSPFIKNSLVSPLSLFNICDFKGFRSFNWLSIHKICIWAYSLIYLI